MKASFILGLLFLISTLTVFSQDSSIVSLNYGNKWYYNYSYHSESPSGSESDHRIEIKEVIGDTILWDGKAYKKIFVISIGDTNTLTRMQYWGLDSLQFYHRNVELLNQTGLNTYYDNRILSDTSSGYFGVDVYQQIFWGVNRNHQKWHDFMLSGGAEIWEESITASGIGPTRIAQGGGVASAGYSWNGSNTIFGALIDGVVYGDTNTVGIIWENNQLNHFLLSQNYPNPFNPITKINYQIPELSFITIKVYDVLGNEITTLVNEEKPAGSYEVEFDGAVLPSGIYYYQLRAGSYIETRKMVYIK